MTIIGILHLPSLTSPATSSQTPAATILSHLSDLYPTQSHQTFFLDHRLFVSTSSLLPNTNTKRTFTHLFTSSHTPQKTYVGTTSTLNTVQTSTTQSSTSANTTSLASDLTTVSISTTSLEPFTSLLTQKFQPQWAPRQFLVLDNGGSIKLPIADDAKWVIGVGDLRLAPSKISGNAAGQLRGVVIELQRESSEDSNVGLSEESRKKYETLFRALLNGLFRNLKLELKMDDAKIYLSQIGGGEDIINNTGTEAEKQQHEIQQSKPSGCEVAELYMEALRGSRN